MSQNVLILGMPQNEFSFIITVTASFGQLFCEISHSKEFAFFSQRI